MLTFVTGTPLGIRKKEKKRKERPADVKPGKSLGVGFYWNLVNTWLCLNRGL
jgi:hypothetical protein